MNGSSDRSKSPVAGDDRENSRDRPAPVDGEAAQPVASTSSAAPAQTTAANRAGGRGRSGGAAARKKKAAAKRSRHGTYQRLLAELRRLMVPTMVQPSGPVDEMQTVMMAAHFINLLKSQIDDKTLTTGRPSCDPRRK